MHPLNESIREIDGSHWLIENALMLSHDDSPETPGQASWNDGNGGRFTLRQAPRPLPPSRPLHQTSAIQKIYEGGTVSAVWQAGGAFIKAKHIALPEATREHTTLDYLHRQQPLGFEIPTVYFHMELEGRYFIILSKLHGRTLAETWPLVDETTRQIYVDRVAAICESLAAWEGDAVSGVDGCQLSDLFLTKRGSHDCRNHILLENCQQQAMDCSSFVFYHCDLGPGNIIISPRGSLGIIDWETAGFVPKEWIRTKFRISSGLDLPSGDAKARTDWRRRVSERLALMQFQDVADGWASWWRS